MPKPFRYIEPTFFSGLFDDPVLSLYIRPLGRSILFDAGQLHHLAKRELKSIDAIFISHAHMDHFMGMDTFIRHSHVSPRTVDIFGPPGLARKMANKFASYDWNLAETFWGNFRVSEIYPDRITSTLYSGPNAFAAAPDGERNADVIYRNQFLKVEGTLCEHWIPVLAYRITEAPAFSVDDARMEAAGVVKGGWLKDLEKLFHLGEMQGNPMDYLARHGEGAEERTAPDAAALYERITRLRPPSSVGYVTDVGFSQENLERIDRLLKGVTLLVCECAFLSADEGKARASRHLTTRYFNEVLERVRPRYALPMHLSKGYMSGSHSVYEEIEPPEGTTLLKLPDRVTPRPIMACEVPKMHFD